MYALYRGNLLGIYPQFLLDIVQVNKGGTGLKSNLCNCGIVIGTFGIECSPRLSYPVAVLSANGKGLRQLYVCLTFTACVEPFAVGGILQVVHQLEFGVVVLASLLQQSVGGIYLQL